MKNEEDQILRKHFTDLAQKADQSHIATFTGFLSLPEQSVFYSMDFSYVPHCVFGGQEGCERAVIRFGEEWEFPICCIKMAPLMNKFADALTHRDFLGALMNLGIERSTLGDIYMAVFKLESNYTKEEIIEFYVNSQWFVRNLITKYNSY